MRTNTLNISKNIIIDKMPLATLKYENLFNKIGEINPALFILFDNIKQINGYTIIDGYNYNRMSVIAAPHTEIILVKGKVVNIKKEDNYLAIDTKYTLDNNSRHIERIKYLLTTRLTKTEKGRWAYRLEPNSGYILKDFYNLRTYFYGELVYNINRHKEGSENPWENIT